MSVLATRTAPVIIPILVVRLFPQICGWFKAMWLIWRGVLQSRLLANHYCPVWTAMLSLLGRWRNVRDTPMNWIFSFSYRYKYSYLYQNNIAKHQGEKKSICLTVHFVVRMPVPQGTKGHVPLSRPRAGGLYRHTPHTSCLNASQSFLLQLIIGEGKFTWDHNWSISTKRQCSL